MGGYCPISSQPIQNRVRLCAQRTIPRCSRNLCKVRILLVGAPAYFDAHGRPTHPRELLRHDALAYTGSAQRGVWRFSHPLFGEETVEPPVRLWSDNADMLNPVLAGGQGLALQPEFLVWRELRDG